MFADEDKCAKFGIDLKPASKPTLSDEDVIRWFLLPSALSTERDVHTEHCCALHGCQYRDADCSVVLSQKRQSCLCESCRADELDLDILRTVQAKLTDNQWSDYILALAQPELGWDDLPPWDRDCSVFGAYQYFLHASKEQKIKALAPILRKAVFSA